jgi:predicted MFS family arabinose efflux permease
MRPAAARNRVVFAMFAVAWGANQFSPLLVTYKHELGLSPKTLALLFAVYAAGLIPGLLVGGATSDRRGRRPVVVPFVVLSPVATLLLVLFRHEPAGLGAGRLLAGVCSGVVFGAATAWVRELSSGEAEGTAARRAAIALTGGFATGPLVASVLAEWAPDPLWLPYVPHLVLGVMAAALLLPTPEGAPPGAPDGPLIRIPRVVRTARFARTVAIVAPWSFASASFSFAILPGETGGATVLLAGAGGAATLFTGVAVQPLARALEDRRPLAAGAAGLLATAIGLGVGVLALAHDSRALVLLAAPLFGVGYGFTLISGLRESERIADRSELGATVSVFYALAYLGFATPYVTDLLNGPFGDEAALAVLAALAIVCLVVSATAAPRRAVAAPVRAG